MSKTLLRSVLAAALLSPAAALAMPNRQLDRTPIPDTRIGVGMLQYSKPETNGLQPTALQDNYTSGNGMTGGNDPGHVATPSNTQIDPSTRGPLNDIQPGGVQSSDPTPAARKAKPVY
jgi:hypothetical protein